MVGENHGIAQTTLTERCIDQFRDFFFLQRFVHVRETQTFRQQSRQNRTTHCGFVTVQYRIKATLFVFHVFGQTHGTFGTQFHLACLVSTLYFLHVSEQCAFAFTVDFVTRHVVQAQNDVLRRYDDRLTIGWRQHVVWSQHQGTGFFLCFQRQWNVYGHLVTVEVGIERRTNEWMQLNGFAFNQNRFKRLNTQTVQSRCTVQHDWMFANHVFQDVPNFWHFLFYQFFGLFDGVGQFQFFQFVENEWFEQFQCHFFRQTTLVQTQVRTYGNHWAAWIVHTFTQQVLTEATALTFNHVCQRFQWAFVGTCHRFTATAVIQQWVHCFLQHAFFIANDDVGCAQFQQTFQTVVTVNHTTVQIVQVRSGKTATIQRYQWTQIRWQYWQHIHDHPLKFHTWALEGFQYFQTFCNFFDFGVRASWFQLLTQYLNFVFDVEGTQQFAHAFCTHFRFEFFAVFVQVFVIVFFGQQLTALQRSQTRIGYHKSFKVQNAFDVTQSHVQNHAQTRWQWFQEPDVRYRWSQFDVPHALTTHFRQCHFHATFFAGHAFEFQTLVFTAQTFIVFDWAKNFGTEQTIAFRFERTVVDGFRFFNFAIRPRAYGFRWCDTNFDGIKFIICTCTLQGVK